MKPNYVHDLFDLGCKVFTIRVYGGVTCYNLQFIVPYHSADEYAKVTLSVEVAVLLGRVGK